MNAKTSPVLFEYNIHHTIYFIITGIFIGTLCLINVINISRFISFEYTFFSQAYTFIIPIGIVPYPITFLCTDIVSECYGKKAANRLVTTGLIANITIFALIWLCGLPDTFLSSYAPLDPQAPHSHFFLTRYLTMTAILSSMLAYLVAQYLDVYLFHLLKAMTKDKHLWLRNNVSTCISQFVDTCLVLGSTYFMTRHLAWGHDGVTTGPLYSLTTVVLSSYAFKLVATLLDTFPCYFFVSLIKKIETNSQTKTRARILFS